MSSKGPSSHKGWELGGRMKLMEVLKCMQDTKIPNLRIMMPVYVVMLYVDFLVDDAKVGRVPLHALCIVK